MLTVAYLANQFPSPVEPYLTDEIEELRRRRVTVIAGSVRRPDLPASLSDGIAHGTDSVVLQPIPFPLALKGVLLCLRRWRRIADLLHRVILQGRETPMQRGKALLHTWLGACYALRLEKRGVEHIHVHHGYFGSWIAMVAARLLRVTFSITLHGSDLLTHAAYLDTKLRNCRYCVTISEYNRRYILEHYSTIEAGSVFVAKLGVDVPEPDRLHSVTRQAPTAGEPAARPAGHSQFHLLSIGRLHPVKDHAFLLRACAQLRRDGLDLHCEIAGAGPERRNLERLIREYELEESVRLLGHVPREQQEGLYQKADLVVLTSRSEGIPLVLMEAMAREKLVLAPAITGIPELVVAGQTGFLYEAGSLEDFVTRVFWLSTQSSVYKSAGSQGTHAASPLDRVRQQAREQVRRRFNRKKNLELFGNLFLERVDGLRIDGFSENSRHEDPLLQQI